MSAPLLNPLPSRPCAPSIVPEQPITPQSTGDVERRTFRVGSLDGYRDDLPSDAKLARVSVILKEVLDELAKEQAPERWIDSIAKSRFISIDGTERLGKEFLKELVHLRYLAKAKSAPLKGEALINDATEGLLATFAQFVRESRGIEIVWTTTKPGEHFVCSAGKSAKFPPSGPAALQAFEKILIEVFEGQFNGVLLAMTYLAVSACKYGPTEPKAISGQELLALYSLARHKQAFPGPTTTRRDKVLATQGYSEADSLFHFLKVVVPTHLNGRPYRSVEVNGLRDFVDAASRSVELVERVLLEIYRKVGVAGGAHFAFSYVSSVVCIGADTRPVHGVELLTAYSVARYLAQNPTAGSTKAEAIIQKPGYSMKDSIDHFKANLGMDLIFAEAVALLHTQPSLLYKYFRINHPELSVQQARLITTKLLKGFAPPMLQNSGSEEIEWRDTFEAPKITRVRESQKLGEVLMTESEGQVLVTVSSRAVFVCGYAATNACYIDIEGTPSRRVAIAPDGYFEVALPLPQPGAENVFTIRSRNDQTEEQSAPLVLVVEHAGVPISANDAFIGLVAIKEENTKAIASDAVRYANLYEATEIALLRDFTASEDEGFKLLQERIDGEQSSSQRALLIKIKERFIEIAKIRPEGMIEGANLFFYQKYAVWWAEQRFEAGKKGLLVALDPALGKTVLALSLVRGKEATFIAPNGVVTTWADEEQRFFNEPQLHVLGGSYEERDLALAAHHPHLVVNQEYLRGLTAARKNLLSRPKGYVVVDEAAALGMRSDQAEGIGMLDAARRLLLSGFPASDPEQLRKIFMRLDPDDPRFASPKAFAKAFPAKDPDALRDLHLVVEECTLRLRKEQIFKSYDRSRPLEEQENRLPEKVFVAPEKFGEFTLLPEQCQALYDLFTDPESWYEKYRSHADPNLDHAMKGGYFSVVEAARQITNDPAYIGVRRPSPKHLELDRIVKHELALNPAQKFLTLSRFRSQVEYYCDKYKAHGACAYYGGLPQDAQGWMTVHGRRAYFRTDSKGRFLVDDAGTLIPATATSGHPIRPLDHARVTFQNSTAHRFIFATRESGSVGITLTAAGVLIEDDQARSAGQREQGFERLDRPDNHPRRKRYETRFYSLIAKYDPAFLKDLPKGDLKKFFSMGTYDRVQQDSLDAGKYIFRQLFDADGTESDLAQLQHIVRRRMPFLFAPGSPRVDGEASKPETPAPSANAAVEIFGEARFLERLQNFALGEFPIEDLTVSASGSLEIPPVCELIENLLNLTVTEHVVAYRSNGDQFDDWFAELPATVRTHGIVAVHRITLGSHDLERDFRDSVVADISDITQAAFAYRHRDGGWHAVQFRTDTVVREDSSPLTFGLTLRTGGGLGENRRDSFEAAIPILNDTSTSITFRETQPPSNGRVVLTTGPSTSTADVGYNPVRELRLILPTLKTPEDWSKHAKLYEEARPYISSYLKNRTALKLVDQLAKSGRIPQPKTCLSALAGTGDLFEAARDLGLGLVVQDLDSSQGMSDLSRNPLRVVADARNMPFEDETFDMVEISAIADVGGPADVAAVIDEVHRVLKTGGIFLIAVDGLFFSRDWIMLEQRGFEFVTPINAELTIVGDALEGAGGTLKSEMKEGLRKARIIIAEKVAVGHPCPTSGFDFLRNATEREGIHELRSMLLRLATPSEDALKVHQQAAEQLRCVIEALGPEERRGSLRTLVRIFDMFLTLFYLPDEMNKGSTAPKPSELTRYVERFEERLRRDYLAVKPSADDDIGTWLADMIGVAGEIRSATLSAYERA